MYISCNYMWTIRLCSTSRMMEVPLSLSSNLGVAAVWRRLFSSFPLTISTFSSLPHSMLLLVLFAPSFFFFRDANSIGSASICRRKGDVFSLLFGAHPYAWRRSTIFWHFLGVNPLQTKLFSLSQFPRSSRDTDLKPTKA